MADVLCEDCKKQKKAPKRAAPHTNLAYVEDSESNSLITGKYYRCRQCSHQWLRASKIGWIKLEALDHQIIRHAYENVLNAAARLIAFATGFPTATDDFLINSRQKILATDDLMLFAINARRLMESVYPTMQFTTEYEVVKKDKKAKKTMREITNILIHHKFIEVVRFNYEVTKIILQKGEIKTFKPVVHVKSDRGEFIAFSLGEIIKKFEIDVLEPIVEFCSEDGLFLDRETYE